MLFKKKKKESAAEKFKREQQEKIALAFKNMENFLECNNIKDATHIATVLVLSSIHDYLSMVAIYRDELIKEGKFKKKEEEAIRATKEIFDMDINDPKYEGKVRNINEAYNGILNDTCFNVANNFTSLRNISVMFNNCKYTFEKYGYELSMDDLIKYYEEKEGHLNRYGKVIFSTGSEPVSDPEELILYEECADYFGPYRYAYYDDNYKTIQITPRKRFYTWNDNKIARISLGLYELKYFNTIFNRLQDLTARIYDNEDIYKKLCSAIVNEPTLDMTPELIYGMFLTKDDEPVDLEGKSYQEQYNLLKSKLLLPYDSLAFDLVWMYSHKEREAYMDIEFHEDAMDIETFTTKTVITYAPGECPYLRSDFDYKGLNTYWQDKYGEAPDVNINCPIKF